MTPYAMLHDCCQFPSSIGQIEYILICERDDNDSEERRDSISEIVPIDLSYVASHERPDDHQSAAGGPGGEASEYGGEEDGDEESETGRHPRDTRLATLCRRRIRYCTMKNEG